MLDLSTTTSTVYLLNIILFKAFFFFWQTVTILATIQRTSYFRFVPVCKTGPPIYIFFFFLFLFLTQIYI